MRVLVDIAVKAAREAGTYLLKSESQIESLEGKDIKLAQDRMSEKIIKEILTGATDYGFLGEESGLNSSTLSKTLWITDPLDGTMNYSRDIPISCVSIALWRDESPLLGVIYDFNRDEMFTAANGELTVNGKVVPKYQQKEKSQAILATGFTSYMSYDNESINTHLKNIQQYKKIRMIGSAALSMAYVACGRFDAYIETDIKLWDVAAGLALVKAAGIETEYCFNDSNFSMDVKCGV